MPIYLDVDGTLVKHKDPTSDDYSSPWEWNGDLLRAILDYVLATNDYTIVVWTGGGAGYAGLWRDRLQQTFPNTFGQLIVMSMAKTDKQLTDKDIVIDDQAEENLKFIKGGRVFTPEGFIEWTQQALTSSN